MALTELTTTIDCERETIDFDSIHEYLRESNLPTRDAAVSMASSVFNQRQMNQEAMHHESEPPKTDELEALWPGVHHDFPQHGVPKSASFYLSIGFAAGAVISIVGILSFFGISHMVTAKASPADANKQVMVAGVPAGSVQGGTATASGDVLVPAAPTVQVQPGDTLAAIAVRNYKRVSPRLLDEICKANNMRNANVLSLGQKINLPEYRPSNQIAATSTTVQ